MMRDLTTAVGGRRPSPKAERHARVQNVRVVVLVAGVVGGTSEEEATEEIRADKAVEVEAKVEVEVETVLEELQGLLQQAVSMLVLPLRPRRLCEALQQVLPLMPLGNGVVAVAATKGRWALEAEGGRVEDEMAELLLPRVEEVDR